MYKNLTPYYIYHVLDINYCINKNLEVFKIQINFFLFFLFSL